MKVAETKLPGWFLQSISRPLTVDEKKEWLGLWRRASNAEKTRMEKLQGWEASEWLHWFSSGNEFWRMNRLSFDSPSGVMGINLTHDDEPFPMGAVEWAASQCGAEVQGIERIT
ncbi:hypothetical protein [Streptomyces sp. NPDC004285]